MHMIMVMQWSESHAHCCVVIRVAVIKAEMLAWVELATRLSSHIGCVYKTFSIYNCKSIVENYDQKELE